MESPWRLAKFVFNYDSARTDTPPLSMAALLDWPTFNSGRFTHLDPSNFMGAIILKQALIVLTLDTAVLRELVTYDNFMAVTRRV